MSLSAADVLRQSSAIAGTYADSLSLDSLLADTAERSHRANDHNPPFPATIDPRRPLATPPEANWRSAPRGGSVARCLSVARVGN